MIKVSLFSQMLAHFPREKFDGLVKKYQSDKHSKGIKSWTHLVSMLFCQIAGASSVRDISHGLRSITGNMYHLGISRVPCKSSLSYINQHRGYEVFKDYYFVLLDHLMSRHSFARNSLKRLKRKIYLMDASIIPLCLEMFDWANYRSTKGAVKLHTVLDYDGLLPVFALLTDGKTAEINVARQVGFTKGSVIVVDRGYLDVKWLSNLDSSGCFYVTREKSNMVFDVIDSYQVEGNVLSDEDIILTGATSKKDYPKKLRRIKFLDSISGKEYVFLTNNFTWKDQTVADIYKERWHIEVFFRQIKQNLKIKSFVGTSENAVQIQIWTALMAILLLKFLKDKAQYDWNLSNLITFVRLNLFVKINLDKWLNFPFYQSGSSIENTQLSFFDG